MGLDDAMTLKSRQNEHTDHCSTFNSDHYSRTQHTELYYTLLSMDKHHARQENIIKLLITLIHTSKQTYIYDIQPAD